MFTIQYNTQIGSYNDIKWFTQKEQYEPYLCEMLKTSNFFEKDLEQVIRQNNGEDDFYSESTGNSYESTLIMPKSFMQELKDGIQIWSSPDFRKKIIEQAQIDLKRMLDSKIKKGKRKIILFNIFPFRKPQIPAEIFYESAFAPFLTTTWAQDIKELHGLIPEGRYVYIISYNPDNRFYIEEIFPGNSNKKEYINRLDKNDGFPFYSEIITPPPSSSSSHSLHHLG